MSKHSNSTHFVQVPRRPIQAMLRVLDDNVANGRALAAGIWRDMLDLATKQASGPLRHPTIERLRELGERFVSQAVRPVGAVR